MQIFFQKNDDYDTYKRDYYPLMLRKGFSWKLFPNLKLYLDMPYPGQASDHISQNLEHYRPDLPVILAKMITLEEWRATGGNEEGYWRMVQTKPSSLIHEIMHHIHFHYFGEDNSIYWQKAAALTGVTLDFTPSTSGKYAFKPAYEQISNYFEDCIEERKENEPFLQFIRDLLGIKYVVMEIGKRQYIANGKTLTMDTTPTISRDGRTVTPARFTHEAFGHEVEFLANVREDRQEVVIVSFNINH